VCYQTAAATGTATANWHGKATGCATVVHCWQLLMLSDGMYLYVFAQQMNIVNINQKLVCPIQLQSLLVYFDPHYGIL
jgi:hypothetical protein